MPVLKSDEIIRYLVGRGFLSSSEADLARARWSPDRDGPLPRFLGREQLLPPEVADDLSDMIANNRLEGLDPRLPGVILLSLVGRGGRGSVYRAWQPSLKRVVAVKLLSADLAGNREYIQRFLREARVASKAQHPGIVRAYDINRAGPHVFMVMEYVRGVSLGQILRKRPTLEAPDAVEIGRLMAEAIGYIARAGLAHRDIKPDNVMIDTRGRVKLCDLGLARSSGATDITQPMMAQGTPAYMAPEAILGADIDAQVDVYSLGVTLYRMLLGKVPFENPDSIEVLRMQVEEQPRGLDGSGLPGALSDLIRRMLEKEPAARPAAGELAAEITALQRTLPGMGGHALWKLVPGGASAASHEPLRLEDTRDVDADEPAPPDPSPPAAIRPLAPQPSGGLPRRTIGAGFGVLSLALAVCVSYILVMTFSGNDGSVEDPHVSTLRQQVERLEKGLVAERSRNLALLAELREAAAFLEHEKEEDARLAATRPRREQAAEILRELSAMRRSAESGSLPDRE